LVKILLKKEKLYMEESVSAKSWWVYVADKVEFCSKRFHKGWVGYKGSWILKILRNVDET